MLNIVSRFSQYSLSNPIQIRQSLLSTKYHSMLQKKGNRFGGLWSLSHHCSGLTQSFFIIRWLKFSFAQEQEHCHLCGVTVFWGSKVNFTASDRSFPPNPPLPHLAGSHYITCQQPPWKTKDVIILFLSYEERNKSWTLILLWRQGIKKKGKKETEVMVSSWTYCSIFYWKVAMAAAKKWFFFSPDRHFALFCLSCCERRKAYHMHWSQT